MTKLRLTRPPIRDDVVDVPGPDPIREKLMPLHTEGLRHLEAKLGTKPGRASLHRWRTTGYPIDRNGPRVRLPTTIRVKRVFTSAAALARWLEAIGAIEGEVREAGGVRAWKASRRTRRPRR